MSYGWAILAVLVIAGAFTNLGGFLSSDKIVSQCRLAPGLNCMSYKVETDGLTLLIRNSLGKDITVNSVGLASAGCDGILSTLVKRDTEAQLNVNCNIDRGKIKSDLVIGYDELDGLDGMSNRGLLVSKVPGSGIGAY